MVDRVRWLAGRQVVRLRRNSLSGMVCLFAERVEKNCGWSASEGGVESGPRIGQVGSADTINHKIATLASYGPVSIHDIPDYFWSSTFNTYYRSR